MSGSEPWDRAADGDAESANMNEENLANKVIVSFERTSNRVISIVKWKKCLFAMALHVECGVFIEISMIFRALHLILYPVCSE